MTIHPFHGSSSIGIRLNYKDVFKKNFTRQALLETLASYPIETVLDYLGRASAVLYNGSFTTVATQHQLCKVFFGTGADQVWSVVELAQSQERPRSRLPTIILFDESWIALTTKIALFALRSDDGLIRSDIHGLGEAMLMVNHLLELNSPIRDNASPDDWAYYTYVMATWVCAVAS